MLRVRQAILVVVAGLSFCTWRVECSGNFTECYNTSTEMHCFSKLVDGTVNFTKAQRRCNEIDATLLVINNDEVQTYLETFISYLNISDGIEDSISYFWTNANRIVESSWQWLNSSAITELNPNVTTGFSYDIHVASLSRQNIGQQEVSLNASNPVEIMNYICEFFGDDCQRQDGNVLPYGNKCYVASKDNGTWYDARNGCLKAKGDLASFGDLKNTNINFTRWLDLSNGKQYWVGGRILWWSWKNSDDAEVRYTNWVRHYPTTVYSSDECVSVYQNSGVTSQINGWKTENCNQDTAVGVICHKVTSFDSSKGSTVASVDSSKDPTISSCSGCANTLDSLESSTSISRAIALGVGIGLGVGIPVLTALIVIIVVVCVRRKRKHRSSGNNLKANSHDYELKDAQTNSLENEKDNVVTEESDKDNVETEDSDKNNVETEEFDKDNVEMEETDKDNVETEETGQDDVETEETDEDNVETEETDKDDVETEETDKGNIETEEKYWKVAKNNSADNDEDQVIDFSESNALNGDGIEYSAVEFADGQRQDDLP